MMENSNFYCWQKWLTYANFKAIFGGLIVAFTGNSFLLHPHNQYTELVFFADEGFSDHTITFKDWLFSIIGGSIVGFHILMGMISENAFKKKERGGYQALWYGLLAWFVIDSGISWYYGAIYNILLINLVALGLIGLPWVMTRREFGNPA